MEATTVQHAAQAAEHALATTPIQQIIYLMATALFILSLRWMGHVQTSRRGNIAGTLAMLLAVIGTFMVPGHFKTEGYIWIAVAIAVGAAVGTPMALVMPMTAVPQRTALSHAFGGLAAALVGTAEFWKYYQISIKTGQAIPTFTSGALSAEILLGFLTFTGSLLAFGKLQEIIPTRPIIYPGRNVVTLATLAAALGSGVLLTIDPSQQMALYVLIASSLLFGVFLILPIGGADMPTVIAILNAYAGFSASAMGFVLDNKLLIVAGALDGSSGLILSILMCRAMNRSFTNVLFGGLGAVVQTGGAKEAKQVTGYSVQDAATILDGARLVMIAPGYGMAVAQAQHAVKELTNALKAKGTDVKFAIHPVAGRMPGHMNVLLAEADVPYDQLLEMEEANPLFPEADVAIVLGANDVTNPAARTNPESPLYGMPMLEVDKAKTVIFVKRGMSPGFAGVDNELFYMDKTMMVFGDAKKVVTDLANAVKGGSGMH